jgi:hypothetical protein
VDRHAHASGQAARKTLTAGVHRHPLDHPDIPEGLLPQADTLCCSSPWIENGARDNTKIMM